jgi:hypothetical protein
MKNADPIASTSQSVGVCQSVSAILWPSFIVAGIANTVFFSFFNPSEMAACRGGEALSTTAVYSIGFFSFWALTAMSSFVTQYFLKPCDNKKNC